MKEYGFIKICNSEDINSEIKTTDKKEALASPEIIERMTKLAKNIKTVSPKSDDFLYFSIIFLKAAESSLLDEYGAIKKLANGEDAWGFFDEDWKWHGNVKPHKNNNLDIFPASELKIAAPKWIGMPLCRDHESSSVDGIRGIILDAHYDDKFKQVVGLCALDKINYPDLARKVQSKIVRYGSMGTAVETSICSECGNRARVQKDYCSHVNTRTAWGEINVGLKPIEYSLVVTPAEPGAVLLRCIASLQEYKSEFQNVGVSDVDSMLAKLSEKQAEHLEKIMKTACGEDGCSLPRRKKIIRGFLENNGIVKAASFDVGGAQDSFSDGGMPEERLNIDFGVSTTHNLLGGGDIENTDFETDATALKDKAPSGSEPLTSIGQANDKIIRKSYLEEIMSGIMEKANLKRRAEERRKIAYFQGGDNVKDKNWKEPAGYKSDKMSETARNQERFLQQTKDMNKLTKEDMAKKEKLSRAEMEEVRNKRLAYLQGGDNVKDKSWREPAGYKSDKMSETARNQERFLQQTKDMNKLTKEDMAKKEKLSRASEAAMLKKQAYTGPALRTKFIVKKNANGSINKAASVFEVYSGDKKIIASTAGNIFGRELGENWDWITSREYGQEVCSAIRESGVSYVSGLLKAAQAAPAPVPAPEVAPAPVAEAPMEEAMPEMPDMSDLEGDDAEGDDQDSGDSDPASQVDEELVAIEGAAANIRDLVGELGEGSKEVDVNVFTDGEKSESADKLSLSRQVIKNLKVAYRKLNASADELAMIAETYENIHRLSRSDARKFEKLATSARMDSVKNIGEAEALAKVAKSLIVKNKYKKASEKMEDDVYDLASDMETLEDFAADKEVDMKKEDEASDLVVQAMDLRRSRRQDLLKKAESAMLGKTSRASEDMKEDDAKDKGPKKDMKAKMEEMRNKKEDSKDKKEDKADDKSDDLDDMSAKHMSGWTEGARAQKNMPSGMDVGPKIQDYIKTEASALNKKMMEKKAEEAREAEKIRIRRAYDLGMDMQRKGLLELSKTALDKQVDEILGFDDKAFEAFKRAVANSKPIKKTASDLGGINVGVNEEAAQSAPISRDIAAGLKNLWND